QLVKSGCKFPLVKHLVSFRRMVFMVFKEGVGELNVVFKFTTSLSLLIQTLNVLNVVKLDILLEPALRGRVTTVFLSDWGGTRPSRPGSFPLWPWSGWPPRAPELPLHQEKPAPEKPRMAEPAVAEPRSAQPDRKKPWSTEKSSVGSGAVLELACADRGRHGGAGQPHGNTGHYTSAGGRGRRGHEQKNGQKRFIHAVRTESGDLLSESTEIRKQTVNFYSKLYSSEWSGAQVVEDSFLVGLPKLSERAARELDRELSLEELHEALQRMENGQASGIDGLLAEFYKAFWAVIGQDVLDVLRDSIRRGELPLSCRRAVLTLLPKKGDLTHLKNWRPVSLLCTDYKLLSKALASRLTKNTRLLGHCDAPGARERHGVRLVKGRGPGSAYGTAVPACCQSAPTPLKICTSEERVQLMDCQRTETGPAEDEPFPPAEHCS
ncbi:hypothetical protein QTP86_023919, partial [Hemibagrus guttatus]